MTKNRSNEDVAGSDCSRRAILSGAAAAPFLIVPRHVLGGGGAPPPSDRLNLACIGVGAQGTRVMLDFLKQPDVQVTAVCDVNREGDDYSEWGDNELRNKVRSVTGAFSWGDQFKGCVAGREPAKRIVELYYGSHTTSGQYGGCTAYNDFRELLSKQSGIDAVVIGTVDHWHAPIAIAAMKAKKHVYCQKPMAHAVGEARRMAEVARESGTANQVAIGNSASEDTRLLQEWIAAGAIGPVRRVENWSTRPFWPQGIDRPADVQPVPDGLDWNLWLGPAFERPFNHVYLPFVWRGWYDFGAGALGDMGQYSFDTIFRVLKLAAPTTVEASSTKPFKETYPAASVVHFEFPARENMPAVTVNWYDGGLRPQTPPELDGLKSGEDNEGVLFIGDRGTMMCGFHGQRPRLIPEAKMSAFEPPPKTLPRSPGHYREWIEAAKGGPSAAANFGFESAVAQAILLGNIAVRTQEKLRWDSTAMKVVNSAAAQELVMPPYRGNWG